MPLPHAREQLTSFLETSNLYITFLFTIEMAIKLAAFGCAGYWSDAFNRFDGLIVGFSLIDVITEDWGLLPPDAPAFTVLRAFRLLRVFRLLKSWTSLQKLLNALMTSLSQLFYLIVLISLLLFIFALLGMQLFGDRYVPPKYSEPPRANFDSIGNAMISVVIVAISENWNVVWMTTKHAVGGWSAIFFVPLTFVANYIMINLVVATLIATFDAQAAEDRKKRNVEIEESRLLAGISSGASTLRDAEMLSGEADEAAAWVQGRPRPASAEQPSPPPSPPEPGYEKLEELEEDARRGASQPSSSGNDGKHASPGALPLSAEEQEAEANANLRAASSTPSPTGLPFADPTRELSPSARTLVREKLLAEVDQDWQDGDRSSNSWYEDYSLMIFSPMHPLRRAAHCLVAFRVPGLPSLSFDNLIIAFIIASSISMAFDSCEVEDNSPLALRLTQIDHVAMLVFVFELILKVIAYGLMFTPNAYLKSGCELQCGSLTLCAALVCAAQSCTAPACAAPACGHLRPTALTTTLA